MIPLARLVKSCLLVGAADHGVVEERIQLQEWIGLGIVKARPRIRSFANPLTATQREYQSGNDIANGKKRARPEEEEKWYEKRTFSRVEETRAVAGQAVGGGVGALVGTAVFPLVGTGIGTVLHCLYCSTRIPVKRHSWYLQVSVLVSV